jgi:hypothetical protein
MIQTWVDHLRDPAGIGELYSPIPAFGEVFLRSVHLSRRSPAVRLRIDLMSLPDVWPSGWREAGYDRVQCQVEFLAVEDVALTATALPELVRISVEPLPRNRLSVAVTGSVVRLNFISNRSLQVGHVSGFRLAPDGGDGSSHGFLSRVDSRLYDTVPGPEVKNYHDRV